MKIEEKTNENNLSSSPKRKEVEENVSISPEPIISKPIQTSVIYPNYGQNFLKNSYFSNLSNFGYDSMYPVDPIDYNFCYVYNSYPCLPQLLLPQSCSDVSKQKTKRFTDFSIKAITES